jgi:hypothetical protein
MMMKMWRLAPVILALLVLPRPAAAQEWIEYTSTQDRFSVNFPSQPTVTESTYTSWLDGKFPAHVHTVTRGREQYKVMMVDYTQAERIHTARAKTCAADPHSVCLGNDPIAQGAGGWKYDVHGAVDFATQEFLKRDAKVTYFAWATIDRIAGRQIHLTNADKSRTFVQIHMYDNRLYVFESTVPAGAPEPGLFQQSPRFLDGNGQAVRFEDNYLNMYPPPPRAGQGRQGGQDGRGGRGQGQQ